ncbi:hypothetical protein Ae406Ps2_5559c [Pseudonocardia sp. Ae406_Ps2]|nr:hypothetical protein Ae331Ps2_0397 [Pseudonocardia sp. Ae331_Ps2]OLM05559.1 hypothetical protein Ae406Ps2_5559c [Pseudonocardia sp. Ae406_Ps2]OLM15493.1 hypothetical protein Ae505Ps2_5625 [Pseudonocardia sp. Ae505_Ps2]OLM27130.1 hypothetical protein Ae706Ps2_5564c [Pseudonocardia sp. Ae706_Ps2]
MDEHHSACAHCQPPLSSTRIVFPYVLGAARSVLGPAVQMCWVWVW